MMYMTSIRMPGIIILSPDLTDLNFLPTLLPLFGTTDRPLHIADLNKQAAQLMTGYGPEWVMMMSVADWRIPGQGLATAPRKATLLKADVTVEKSMTTCTDTLPAADKPVPAPVVLIDMPWGLDMHDANKESNAHKVLKCDKAWDTNAWCPQEMMSALKASETAGLLDPRHCLIIWPPRDKLGDFVEALKSWNYSAPQVVTWMKIDGNR
jgi:hypothetical protein